MECEIKRWELPQRNAQVDRYFNTSKAQLKNERLRSKQALPNKLLFILISVDGCEPWAAKINDNIYFFLLQKGVTTKKKGKPAN